MLKESSFALALSLSLLGHASLFLFSPSYVSPNRLITPNIQTEEVEVTYFRIKEAPQWGGSFPKEAPTASGSTDAAASVSLPIEPPAAKQVVVEKKLDLSEEELLYQEMASRLQDPVFLTYYQGIREKIRKAAKRRYQGRTTQGDISLGFTLFSSGRLKEVSILRETPQQTSPLRAVAVQSVLDASPFPPFPDILDRDHLSFVVVLTFKPNP